jgi:hypothetical protein
MVAEHSAAFLDGPYYRPLLVTPLILSGNAESTNLPGIRCVRGFVRG